MAGKAKKVERKILRTPGQPTHFTRKQVEQAVRKVREERLKREKAERRGDDA